MGLGKTRGTRGGTERLPHLRHGMGGWRLRGERHKFTHRKTLTLCNGSNIKSPCRSVTPPRRPPGVRR